MLATKWRSWGTRLGLVSFIAMGGAIAVFGDCASAQITPDGTLGAESSVVTPNVINGISSDQIDGGAKRGANLFHSFREFNIDEGRGAYFTNPVGIENILSRVTGSNPSNILGTLGVTGGNANLFLMNPNGIIFGPSSSLNVNGSFVGTTANAIGLVSGEIFSANPRELLPTQLLNVNPNAFLFNQITTQAIINRSTVSSRGLEVPEGRSLLLMGGDVRLEGGRLFSPGGRIELGGLASSGRIGLAMNDSQERLSFPNDVAQADVYLTNSGSNTARVNVAASNGGSIAITARNIDVLGGSVVRGGLETGLGFPGAQAGDIKLQATGEIALANSSVIANNVRTRAVGKGGDINIQTGSLSVTNGAQLQAAMFGQGDAGSVTILAHDTVSFDAGDVFSTVGSGAVGNGGDINITTGSLSVTNGAQLDAGTEGQGDAGSVTIVAHDTVSFDGQGSDGALSGTFSTVEEGAVGKGGGINVTTGSLSVTNGAQLQALTRGKGDAGSVTIDARDTVSFDGVSSDGFSSTALSNVAEEAVGNGSSINITTGSLSVTNGAQLDASTEGQGDAGSVNINARDTVSFDGVSGASSNVEEEAVGKGGGSINITTGSLSVTNGAQLAASTRGQGDAGSVNINARDTVSFDGQGSDGLSSLAFSTVEEGAVGKGGGVNITTGSLSVTNGAQLATSTRGQGDAGSVTINARDTISFDGQGSNGLPSAAFSTVEEGAVGKGGGVNITTGSLSVTNGAQLAASSEGNGAAGNIEVVADSIRLDNQAFLSSDTTGGQGNIILRSQDLVLRRGSNITTDATGTATGGNITIDTGVLAALENSDITANAEEASGGRVIINAQGIFGTEFRDQPTSESDITATSTLGPQFSGSVEINTSNVDLNQGLVTLPVELVNVEGLIANSCIARSSEQGGNFNITGAGGLPTRPGDAAISPYPTGTVRSIPNNDTSSRSSQRSSVQSTNKARRWKMGDPIVEPQGVYRLANGELVMSRKCSN